MNGHRLRLIPDCWRAFPSNYEAAVEAVFERAVRAGTCIFDVGAHVGVHSLILARLATPTGHVFAFEPAPLSAALLRRHIDINCFSECVTVVEATVGAVEGETRIWTSIEGPDPGNGPLVPTNKPGRILNSKTVTLDGFCAGRGVYPDFVKIDVEGCEYRVLQGGVRVLSTPPRPVVVCALHPWHLQQLGSSEPEVFALVAKLGLRVLDLDWRPTVPLGVGREVIFTS
jgi:FkbM family methyltransferase